MTTQTSLVSAQNRIEAPFIVIQVGDYTFGTYSAKEDKEHKRISFPNYVKSLNVKKVNGTVNTYNIKIVYPITEKDDPNLLERIFSTISDSRIIHLQYGDSMTPNYIFKEEEVIVSKITSQIDFKASRIDYTISAVSNSINLTAGVENFPAKFAKPSDEIKRIFNDSRYGLLDLFYGMKSYKNNLEKFIPGDDKPVNLEGKENVSVLTYINYLVNCMCSWKDDPRAKLKQNRYYWAVFDDISNEYGGPYIKIVQVTNHINYNIQYNTYEIDVGYPAGNFVTNFSINNDGSWSILYKHANDIQLPEYTYIIDNNGKLIPDSSSSLMTSKKYTYETEASRTWWSNMTQYPISAKITIKGLLRPAILMSHVRVNAYFYGNKHISSGLYIINQQEDSIDNQGYRTTLTLTRISGDAQMNDIYN